MFSAVLLMTLSCSFVQEGKNAAATIVVRLPAAAKLFVDDFPSSQTGEKRILNTPPLEPGYTYSYSLRIELAHDGRLYRLGRKISFRAGEEITVHFRDPRPGRAGAPRLEKPKKGIADKSKKQPAFVLSREEQKLLDLTNKERAQVHLPPLAPNAKLFKAARDHSANMAKQDRLEHTLDDKGPAERMRESGYQGFNWGENIAFGQATPAQAIETWMDSAGHRANILGKDYTEIGIGIVRNDRGVPYYTQVFGRAR